MNTESIDTKGWVTTVIRDLSSYREVGMEVTIGQLPASTHLHIALFPIQKEGRRVWQGVPQGDGRLPVWPHAHVGGSGTDGMDPPTGLAETEAASAWIEKEWLGFPKPAAGDPPPATLPILLCQFKNRVDPVVPAYVETRPKGLRGPQQREYLIPNDPGNWTDFPGANIPAWFYGYGAGSTAEGEMNFPHIGRQAPHPAGLTGEEYQSGDIAGVDLTPWLAAAGWEAVRVAVACYHHDPATGKDEAFALYPTQHMSLASPLIPVDEWDYPNDPFFLWLPWFRSGGDPFWLSHDGYVLHPSTRPSMSSLLNHSWDGWWDRVYELRESQGTMMKFTRTWPFRAYPPTALRDWSDVVGEETSQWWLSWTESLLEFSRWKRFQAQAKRTVLQNEVLTMVTDPAEEADGVSFRWIAGLLPSHAFLAEWLQFAGGMVFPHAFQDAGGEHPDQAVEAGSGPPPTDWPKRLMLPTFLYGGSASVLQDAYRAKYRGWDGNYFQRFDKYPASWESHEDAFSIGASLSNPLADEAKPVMLTPTLPLAFGQYRVLNGVEIPNALYQSIGNLWSGMQWFCEYAFPAGVNNEGMPTPSLWKFYMALVPSVWTTFLEQWDAIQSQAPHMAWLGRSPANPHGPHDAWLASEYVAKWIEMDILLASLGIVWGGEGMGGSFYLFGQNAPPFQSVNQPVFEFTTTNYSLARLKVIVAK